jgi:hypothetical protein
MVSLVLMSPPEYFSLLLSFALKMFNFLKSLTLYDIVVQAMSDDTTFERLNTTLTEGRRTSLTVV